MNRLSRTLLPVPLLAGCVYLQAIGLFPTGGGVEDSPTGKSIVAGVMVNEQGRPLAGIVMLERGRLFGGKFVRGGVVDAEGRFAVEVPEGGDWGLHGYSDGYIYHPEAIEVVPGKINRFRWVLPADEAAEDNPRIRKITLTPEPTPGATVAITLDAFDPNLRLSEQVLALNTRTGDAFVLEPPEPPRWGRPFEGKLSPNGTYRATYGPLPPESNVHDWVFVLANEDCSISRITRYPFEDLPPLAIGALLPRPNRNTVLGSS